MVGLPYENEKDFEDTLKLVLDIEFDDAFMYKFSKERILLLILWKIVIKR